MVMAEHNVTPVNKDACCDSCGESLYDDTLKMSIIAIRIDLSEHSGNHKEIKRVLDTFGKTKFDICFTCWLKSLGVRPKDMLEII